MLLLGVCLRSVCGGLRAMRVLIMQIRWVTYILKGWRGEFTVTRDRPSWAWFQKASRGTLNMRMVIRGSYDILRFDSARMLAAGMQAYVCRCVYMFMYPYVYACVCICWCMCAYMHVHVYMYMQMHSVLICSNISGLSKPFPNRSRMLPPLLPTPSHLPSHPPPSLPPTPYATPSYAKYTQHAYTYIYGSTITFFWKDGQGTMFTVYADVQSVCDTCCRPSSQSSQTYSLFATFVADLVHSFRRRTQFSACVHFPQTCLWFLLQT